MMVKNEEMLDDVIGRCAAVRTLSAARTMTRLYDDALRPVGLTITQFTLLVTIGRARPDSISSISEWLNIDRTSLTRNIKLLEVAGYVKRGDEGQRHRRQIELTSAGHRVLRQAYPLWQAAQERVEGEFSQKGFSEAKKSLRALRTTPV